ncbi:interferon-inducible GTPase 5-like [Hyla sarda]|uniref:interferon-inducible GTPase 5-like n=1 Tax=Hyla sarda TaxID=327740 RepID=UPI0024C39103|nr:interferon-inducible GTPase 5-like [Hyla sarda]XP_056399525.1 interferon-inducible GTPase 5-like [Hyla sarda]XP_056399526.1 interferon-inducible GTPase 5-like [Hyla sarda]XP_056399527.1 interferon-inducible GTPase 5-like [Hyla sarda]
MDSKNLVPENELQEMRNYFENEDFAGAVEEVKKYLEDIDQVPLNIAVTGEPGSGKSTFINVIRGLNDEEKDSAKTGVVETTMSPTAYLHPHHRNVRYWDLPGIGSPGFKPMDYLKLVEFDRYDFFLIITTERFRECHILLAQAIQSMGKKFYFLRSKIDSDLKGYKRGRANCYKEEDILKKIREDSINGLKAGGIGNPQVFLLSCLEPDKYDFYLIQKTLEDELPSHKRHIFLLSQPNFFQQALKKKRKTFRLHIWKWAIVSMMNVITSQFSGAHRALSVPHLSTNGDLTLIVNVLEEYKKAFGLDTRSLQLLADTFGKDPEDLRSVIETPTASQEITHELVFHHLNSQGLTDMGRLVTACTNQFVPKISTLASGGIAFGTTYWILSSFLANMAEDAARVLSKALEASD